MYKSRMTDLSILTSEERDELADIYARWRLALDEKDYTTADRVREELLQWQDTLVWLTDTPPKFNPVAEPAWHRAHRYEKRHND